MTTLKTPRSAAVLAAVAVLAVGAGACARNEAPAPKLLQLSALKDGTSRPLKDGAELMPGELVGFQLELEGKAYVYVFVTESNYTRLAWGTDPKAPPMTKGVYEPDWEDGKPGLRFTATGPIRLNVVASPEAVPGAEQWDAQALEHLESKCPHCSVATTSFKLVEK